MEVIHPRAAAIDVGKKVIAVAVRTPGTRRQQIRKYKTFYRVLGEMVAWPAAEGRRSSPGNVIRVCSPSRPVAGCVRRSPI